MKKVLLMLSAISLLTIASCSKSKNEPVQEETPTEKLSDCLVKSTENLSSSDGTIYSNKAFITYNDLQKITRIDYDVEKSTDFKTFTYEKSKITIRAENTSNRANETDERIYTLDAQGRIASSPDDYRNAVTNFSYNTEGYLAVVKKTYVDSDTKENITETKTYSYTDGNLTKMIYEISSPTKVFYKGTSTISYLNDALENSVVASKVFDSITPDEVDENLISFIGKKSKNLPGKVVSVDIYLDPISNGTSTFQFTYQKDAKGNVTSLKTSQSTIYTNGNTYSYNEEDKFSYTCK